MKNIGLSRVGINIISGIFGAAYLVLAVGYVIGNVLVFYPIGVEVFTNNMIGRIGITNFVHGMLSMVFDVTLPLISLLAATYVCIQVIRKGKISWLDVVIVAAPLVLVPISFLLVLQAFGQGLAYAM